VNNSTVKVSNTTLNNLRIIAGKINMTMEEATSEMLERGVKDFMYRSKRNADKWQERKAKDARLAELEAIHEGK